MRLQQCTVSSIQHKATQQIICAGSNWDKSLRSLLRCGSAKSSRAHSDFHRQPHPTGSPLWLFCLPTRRQCPAHAARLAAALPLTVPSWQPGQPVPLAAACPKRPSPQPAQSGRQGWPCSAGAALLACRSPAAPAGERCVWRGRHQTPHAACDQTKQAKAVVTRCVLLHDRSAKMSQIEYVACFEAHCIDTPIMRQHMPCVIHTLWARPEATCKIEGVTASGGSYVSSYNSCPLPLT